MPARGRLYVWLVILAGSSAVVHAVRDMLGGGDYPTNQWLILALLTLVSGSATVKIPSISAHISVSETFLFSSVLLYGPSAGVLTVLLDALIITVLKVARRERRTEQVLFNLSAPPLAMWVGAHVYAKTSNLPPLEQLKPLNGLDGGQTVVLGALIVPLILFAVVYFALSSGLVACAVAFAKGASPIRVWREHFLWLSLNYFGGASVAALLVFYTRKFDWTALSVTIPLLLVLYLTFRTSMARVADATKHLEELNALYLATVHTLAAAIDAKDQVTHGHIRRVQTYSAALAAAVGIRNEVQLKAIQTAAILHDTGKIAIPESILNKPGPLEPDEFAVMKSHAAMGADIISSIKFPYPVEPIVRHHHENWDGTGYPDRLVGTQTPIGARILAVVDCFDALTSDRPYRARMSDEEALAIVAKRRGTMYDPLVVDAFFKLVPNLTREELGDQASRPLAEVPEAPVGPRFALPVGRAS
jgi:putative nucleotidyltransferase with HDIG domain